MKSQMANFLLLWLNNIPLSSCTHFLHSFVSGHFDCFHILVVYNAEVNMGVYMSLVSVQLVF